jgi:hypothetical protein
VRGAAPPPRAPPRCAGTLAAIFGSGNGPTVTLSLTMMFSGREGGRGQEAAGSRQRGVGRGRAKVIPVRGARGIMGGPRRNDRACPQDLAGRRGGGTDAGRGIKRCPGPGSVRPSAISRRAAAGTPGSHAKGGDGAPRSCRRGDVGRLLGGAARTSGPATAAVRQGSLAVQHSNRLLAVTLPCADGGAFRGTSRAKARGDGDVGAAVKGQPMADRAEIPDIRHRSRQRLDGPLGHVGLPSDLNQWVRRRIGPADDVLRHARSDGVCFPCTSSGQSSPKIAVVLHAGDRIRLVVTAFDPTPSVDTRPTDRKF